MTLKEFELSINLLIQTWLTPSLGTASYAENRVKFDEALKVALIEKLRLTNNNAIPLANTNLIKIKDESTLILCKTINTNFVYYPCIEHTPLNEKINSINIEHDIADLSRWMTDLHKKNIENAYIIFILYPCTHNDRDWSQYHNIINDLIPQKLFHIDFRFANNAPGVLYYAKVEISESELIKIQNLINKYYSLDKLTYKTYNVQSNRIRERIKFKDTGTYFKVLQNIQNELLLNKNVIKVSELQEIFESRIKDIIVKENPDFSDEQIKESLKTIDSNGTGAKKAQILLNTVNEKNRIHYRPKLDIDSRFNLFIYDENDPENTKFINRKIKAFDINDKSILDKTLYYSVKADLGEKREPIPIRIKDSELMNIK